jgi:hypothetical protein
MEKGDIRFSELALNFPRIYRYAANNDFHFYVHALTEGFPAGAMKVTDY